MPGSRGGWAVVVVAAGEGGRGFPSAAAATAAAAAPVAPPETAAIAEATAIAATAEHDSRGLAGQNGRRAHQAESNGISKDSTEGTGIGGEQ